MNAPDEGCCLPQRSPPHLRPPPSPPPPPPRLRLFCRLSKLLRASDMEPALLIIPGRRGAEASPAAAAGSVPLPALAKPPPPSPAPEPPSDQSDCALSSCSNMETRLLKLPGPPVLPPPRVDPPGVPGRDPEAEPGPPSPPSSLGRMLPAEMRCRAGSCGWSREDLVRLWWYSRICTAGCLGRETCC